MLNSIAATRGIRREAAEAEVLRTNRPHSELRRAGMVEEVTAAVAFLASERASFITGTSVRVDGGSVASIA
jgi:NAD(P)-dependent dehydrogenase (short-subunit alcohol dehydrogenase family)